MTPQELVQHAKGSRDDREQFHRFSAVIWLVGIAVPEAAPLALAWSTISSLRSAILLSEDVALMRSGDVRYKAALHDYLRKRHHGSPSLHRIRALAGTLGGVASAVTMQQRHSLSHVFYHQLVPSSMKHILHLLGRESAAHGATDWAARMVYDHLRTAARHHGMH